MKRTAWLVTIPCNKQVIPNQVETRYNLMFRKITAWFWTHELQIYLPAQMSMLSAKLNNIIEPTCSSMWLKNYHVHELIIFPHLWQRKLWLYSFSLNPMKLPSTIVLSVSPYLCCLKPLKPFKSMICLKSRFLSPLNSKTLWLKITNLYLIAKKINSHGAFQR